jgi:hypothetical protein
LIFREIDDDGNDLTAPGEELDYLSARPGDHLFCPFECDGCSFYRLKQRLPDPKSRIDSLLQIYLRRANLDAFWSRRPGTVEGMRRLFFAQAEVGDLFGFEMFDRIGPFPHDYDSGIRSAIGTLWQSQKAGRHEEKQKYSSVRKVRSLHTNLHNASAKAASSSLVWRSEKGRFITTTAPSDREWHVRFMSGLHARIGDRRKRDAAISIEQMIAVQSFLEAEWQEGAEQRDTTALRRISEIACFFLLGYCGSLRGFEIPKALLTSLRHSMHLEAAPHGQPPHAGIFFLGRFKARSNAEKKVLVFVAAETKSGLQPVLWLDRLVTLLNDLGIFSGWLFQGPQGEQRFLSFFHEEFYRVLFSVRDLDPSLFEPNIDILEDYHLARSLRRGATTRATNAGVAQQDIDWVNRWNTQGEELIAGPMRVIYSDRKQLLETFLRFSQAL